MGDTRDKLILAIKEAFGGSRKIRVVFKQTSLNRIGFLSTMRDHGMIQINMDDLSLLIRTSHNILWNNILYRSIEFTLTDKFDRGWFIDMMGSSFESVEVIKYFLCTLC